MSIVNLATAVDTMENNEHFLVQVFYDRSKHESICLVESTNIEGDFTILQATRRSSDLRRAACTVAKPPLPRICKTS